MLVCLSVQPIASVEHLIKIANLLPITVTHTYNTHTHAYIHTHIHTYTHIHTHTHKYYVTSYRQMQSIVGRTLVSHNTQQILCIICALINLVYKIL